MGEAGAAGSVSWFPFGKVLGIEKGKDMGEEENIKGGSGAHPGRFVFMAFGLLVFAALVAAAVFFFAVQGEEEQLVPDVRGKDIINALLELQEKELYTRLQLRYTETGSDRGTVLEQDPMAGAIVKAGRRIRLVVSQGVMISSMEDYRGRSVDDVRMELKTLFAADNHPQIILKEPFMYEYSQEPAGTVLQQYPGPGASLAGTTTLEFVVSKGAENAVLKAPNFVGLSLDAALEQLGKANIVFAFTVRPVEGNEKAETVVAQVPPAGMEMEANTRMTLTFTGPGSLPQDMVFDTFEYFIPQNPYPLNIRLDAQLPSGDLRTLLRTAFSGGSLAIPYKLPAGTVLILSMMDRELYRKTVAFSSSFLIDQL
jgi:beta-lactam-binding protein with PASTA domain